MNDSHNDDDDFNHADDMMDEDDSEVASRNFILPTRERRAT